MGNRGARRLVSKELTTKQITMLKINTKYSEHEIRQWHKGFLHDCPTGKLDRKTFAQVYKKFYPHGKVDNFCKRAFTTFDMNDDGVIDFSEFLLAIAVTNQGDINDRLGVAFDMYDFSKDGEIDQKELAGLISSMYDLFGETDRKGDRNPEKRAADIISKLDINGNRMVNKEEFITGCKNDAIIRHILAPNS